MKSFFFSSSSSMANVCFGPAFITLLRSSLSFFFFFFIAASQRSMGWAFYSETSKATKSREELKLAYYSALLETRNIMA